MIPCAGLYINIKSFMSSRENLKSVVFRCLDALLFMIRGQQYPENGFYVTYIDLQHLELSSRSIALSNGLTFRGYGRKWVKVTMLSRKSPADCYIW